MQIHIVGCPRSGTTLMMELMATCYDTVRLGSHELSIFRAPEQRLRSEGGKVFLSKQPTDILHVGRLLTHDHSLHILVMTRDPRAVITSFHPGCEKFFVNYRIWQQCDMAMRDLVGHPRVMHVCYEDLVHDPDIHQQLISRHFGFLRQRHKFSEYSRYAKPDSEAIDAMNGLRPIDNKGIGRWRQHLARIKHQLQLHPQMQEALEFHCYEPDAEWQSQLDDVSAIEYGCRYPERANWLKEVEKRVRVWCKMQRYIQVLTPPRHNNAGEGAVIR